jgi:hypothetical protein
MAAMLNLGSTPRITKAESLPKEHFCKATFHFGQIVSKRHLQTSKTTDANDEKCRSDANLMKEVERGHFVVSFITGRSNFKLND